MNCNRAELVKALFLMPAPKNSSRPILECVGLFAKGGSLHIEATDMERSLRAMLTCSGKQINTCVPKALLQNILSKMRDEEVSLMMDNEKLCIRGENVDVRLLCEKPEDFPSFQDASADAVYTQASFVEAIGRVLHAAPINHIKHILNGVYIGKDIVATDGKRMAIVKGLPLDSEVEAIVPTNTAFLLRKAECNEICIMENAIHGKADGYQVFGWLLDGSFVDYEAVIPKGCNKTLRVDKAALIHALQLAALINCDTVYLVMTSNTLTISAESFDAGSILKTIDAVFTGADDFNIKLPPRQLLDMLAAVSADLVFKFKDNETPMIIEDGEDYLEIIVPVVGA